MVNDALAYMAKKNGNVVKYDSAGNPSIYVPINRCLSSDLHASLPAHVHPAFKVGETILDQNLIGKYKASALDGSTVLYSIPGRDPANNINYDMFLTRLRSFASGASGITIADHGLLMLLAVKYGWQPKGNNNYGADYRDGTRWQEGQTITAGDERVYRGWRYKALVDHTSAAANAPENNPAYWEKGKHVGGVMSADTGAGNRTLTGSGPSEWYLGNDVGNIADPQGDATEQVYGCRLYDGEIQILSDDNTAALPTTDCSANAAWKAILPGASETDYTLVTPGTTGTLHYNWLNSKVTLDTETVVEDASRSCKFTDMAVNTDHVANVPVILRELGLFPLDGLTQPQKDLLDGTFYYNSSGERVPRRSGTYFNASDAGMGYLYFSYDRSHSSDRSGARGRFFES